jgi:hypothetical protein
MASISSNPGNGCAGIDPWRERNDLSILMLDLDQTYARPVPDRLKAQRQVLACRIGPRH